MTTSGQRPDPFSLHPGELLLLGRITGWDLPRPWFDVFLFGRLSLQRELEDAQADADRLYQAMCARPAPPSKHLSGPSFVELSRIRGDHQALARAETRERANARFGRGVA